MKKYMSQNGNLLDNGAGPGEYSMEFAKSGYTVTLTDFTPKLVEIAERKAQEFDLTEQFNGFYVADARNLSDIKKDQFDASLMLGPVYIKPFMEAVGFESLELIGSNVGAILNNDHWNYWRDKGEHEIKKSYNYLLKKRGILIKLDYLLTFNIGRIK